MNNNQPRLPAGQRLTEDWPILHYGGIPSISTDEWSFKIGGLVENPIDLNWNDFMDLPQLKVTSDIHCVTTWSKYDNEWEGVSMKLLIDMCKPKEQAKHVMFHSYGGYTTNVPIEDLLFDNVLIAHSHNGSPLDPQHGAPARGVVPHLYFWKSAKWVNGMEFITDEEPGFWENYGYHIYGDPWKEQRYS
ncbi:MAG: sulfite oxidase-like oxidoreductase [Dehalococcoidia bacterium]|nr:sulfite oxidase-like oxidoreductase [Dehalococcoidia bacterium]